MSEVSSLEFRVSGPATGQLETRNPELLLGWISTVDHKRIGLLYLVTSAAFFLVGGIEALLIRLQLAVPRSTLLSPDAYNAVFTMHGTTMIFLVVMPVLLGFANYFVPLMIGARDMAFPRLNALSYWLLLFGGLVLNFGFLAGAPPDTGWFSNAPLPERPFTMNGAADYWALGLLTTSVGTIATGLNLVVTVAKLRAPGMTPSRIPVFVWMSAITGLLIIWAIPSLTAAQVMLLLDRHVGTHFFDTSAGADPLLWQHLFWFFGHPEVYIMVLPAFGIMSEVVPVFSRKPLFGYAFVVGSGVAIAFYSLTVWAHHMFTTGLGEVSNAFFGAASMIIAVPTGIKVFSWLGTMTGGRLRFTTPMLFCIAFIVQFVVGGLSGVHFAVWPVDWQTHDTYYVVAHFHYVLFGGSFFGVLAGLYYWFPKMAGRLLDERLGRWHFWLTVVGFNLTFFPMHVLGLMGQRRRTYTYPDLPGWGALNFVETIGAFIMAASVLVMLWNLYVSLRRGRVAGDNPWDAWTLEWATTSPPPAHNFAALPPIHSARPLWDLQHEVQPSLAATGTEATVPPATEEAPLVGATPPASDVVHAPGGWFERVSLPVLGTLAFISSEAVFFGALIVSYLEYRTRSAGGPGPSVLEVGRTGLFSLALFASSGTIWLADRRLQREDWRGFATWVGVTILLGVVFLFGQATEYARLVADGVTPGRNLFTSAFYGLTGFHGAHVIVGVIALAIVGGLSLAGDFRHGRHSAASAVSAYWHFVDAVWVVLFTLIYLWTLV